MAKTVGLAVFWKSVVALGYTPGDVQVNKLIGPGVALNQGFDEC